MIIVIDSSYMHKMHQPAAVRLQIDANLRFFLETCKKKAIFLKKVMSNNIESAAFQ